jgi:hypothetical protein
MFYAVLQVEFGSEGLATVSPVAARVSPSTSYGDSAGKWSDFFFKNLSDKCLSFGCDG